MLGGGRGTRLWPLTRYRAKPAVPVGGKFRLIDIPISNSLHAGIDKIYVLTQYNSASLHRHITQTYRFDIFSSGFVHILAAEQRMSDRTWYQGTADAVRRNLDRLVDAEPSDVLILSGDQLYVMDIEAFVDHHRRAGADLTVAVKPVSREAAAAFGIMRVAEDGRIVEFVEKPQDPEVLDDLALDSDQLRAIGFEAPAGSLLASLGIYIFRLDILARLLDETDATDFGHEVIPEAIDAHAVHSYSHTGYWRDIGTISTFHQANIDLTRTDAPVDLYDPSQPIYTHARFLPGTKIDRCEVEQSILCEGSILRGSSIRRSVIGIRSAVQEGSLIENSVVMGATTMQWTGRGGELRMGVGRDCTIRNAIIDFDARIGDGCRLVNEAGVDETDEEHYSIRGGIIVVPREAVVPPGSEI